MIKFEINEFPFALTNDQFDKINDIIRCAPELDYDIVEGDQGRGMVWLWAHHEVEDECENPTRYWIEVDGTVSLAEEVTWDWSGVGTPTPERFDLSALYPIKQGEDAGKWTDRVLTHAKEHGTNRQCSIGWHMECSDPDGEECMCLCHHPSADWYSVEGDAEGGTLVVRRSEIGKQHWPPTEGEPATIWAVWILGLSADDASARAIKQEEARRG